MCDETATTFMTDLPLLKSKFLLLFAASNQVSNENGHLRFQGSCFDGIISSDLGVSHCISLLLCLLREVSLRFLAKIEILEACMFFINNFDKRSRMDDAFSAFEEFLKQYSCGEFKTICTTGI